jgi:hypothetical protein
MCPTLVHHLKLDLCNVVLPRELFNLEQQLKAFLRKISFLDNLLWVSFRCFPEVDVE